MAEKILIVDDDPATAKYLSIFLTRLGYETLQAADGIRALSLAHEQPPDLIVLDVMMPGLDGYEVARRLRRQPETMLIPILMFTALSQIDDQMAGYEAGADIYLTKPVRTAELQISVRTLLDEKKARAAALAKKAYLIGVVAAKGGLGVSSVALNLAIAYQYTQRARVIAAEMRPRQGCWAEELGIAEASGLNDLLSLNYPDITPATVKEKLVSGRLKVSLLLAGGPGSRQQAGALPQYEAIIDQARQMADLLILDIGTPCHPAYDVFTDLCNEMVIVTEPQPLAIQLTHNLINDLKQRCLTSTMVLTLITVNRYRAETSLQISAIEKTLGQSVMLGLPPMPELAWQAIHRKEPLYLVQSGSTIAQQFDRLAAQVAAHIPQKPAAP